MKSVRKNLVVLLWMIYYELEEKNIISCIIFKQVVSCLLMTTFYL